MRDGQCGARPVVEHVQFGVRQISVGGQCECIAILNISWVGGETAKSWVRIDVCDQEGQRLGRFAIACNACCPQVIIVQGRATIVFIVSRYRKDDLAVFVGIGAGEFVDNTISQQKVDVCQSTCQCHLAIESDDSYTVLVGVSRAEAECPNQVIAELGFQSDGEVRSIVELMA